MVALFDGVNVYVYVNGTSLGSTGKTLNMDSSTGFVGAQNSSTKFFNGAIDDLRIYNRAITSAEVTQLYTGSSPVNCDQTCVGWWRMNDNAANTTVADSSGAGNTGTAQQNTSVLTTSGIFAGGLTFNGSSDYIDAGNSATVKPTFPFTTEAWFKITSLPAIISPIISSSDVAGNGFYSGFSVYVNSTGTIAARAADNGGTSTSNRKSFTSDNAVISANTWYHVTAVYTDINNIAIYLNGASVAGSMSGTGTTLAYAANNKLRIGAFYYTGDATTKYFPGSIDDVRLYNRVLSASEINEHYLAGRP